MPRPHTTWTVLPHGDLEALGADLYTVEGVLRMPAGETTRRMTIVRLAGERLLIWSAMALDEARMRTLEALGEPAVLVVPSAIHRLDVRPWKDRFPRMAVVAPPAARRAVGAVVSVDATSIDLGDRRARVDVVRGTGGRELALEVETETGTTLVLNDVVFNLRPVPGIAGLALRALGFGPGHVRIPPLVKKRLVVDEAALARQLRTWAALPRLERVLVSHGAPIDDAPETLRALARGLDAPMRRWGWPRRREPARAT